MKYPIICFIIFSCPIILQLQLIVSSASVVAQNGNLSSLPIPTKAQCNQPNAEFSCFCPKICDPVCGTDNKEYDNSCIFECAQHCIQNLHKAHRGKCRTSST